MLRLLIRLTTFDERKICSYSNFRIAIPFIVSLLAGCGFLILYQIKVKGKVEDIAKLLDQMKAEELTQENLDAFNAAIMNLVNSFGLSVPFIGIAIIVIGFISSLILYQARRSHTIKDINCG